MRLSIWLQQEKQGHFLNIMAEQTLTQVSEPEDFGNAWIEANHKSIGKSIDKAKTDKHGKLALEPFHFTLVKFECRVHSNAMCNF